MNDFGNIANKDIFISQIFDLPTAKNIGHGLSCTKVVKLNTFRVLHYTLKLDLFCELTENIQFLITGGAASTFPLVLHIYFSLRSHAEDFL